VHPAKCKAHDLSTNCKGKNQATPVQAWTDPESSRRMRFLDFKTKAHEGGTVVSPTHRPPLPQEIFLVLISVTG